MHPFAGGSFVRAIKRVQVIDGDLKIYEPDAPEVTGVMEMVTKLEVQ